MRTAPVRAGCTGATPAFHGQRAWTGNPPQTAIDRKPLQTDKLTGRAFDDEVYAVVAQIPAGKIVSYKQIARLIGMPDHARRVGRAMASAPAGLPCHRVVNSAGRTAPGCGSCSKRKASASRPTAAPTSLASCGRKSCKPHGTHTRHSRGEHREPCREGHSPHPAGHDRPAGRGNISPEKIWHSAPKPLSSHHPAYAPDILRRAIFPAGDAFIGKKHRMKRYILLLSALFAATLSAVAQRPLYIVNGVETEEIESIPPDDIENIESLPADEETIARYGEKAANGVILISLRYDKPAIFEAGTTFDEYIAGQVKWDDDEPAARIILRYTVTPEGKAVLAQELESTDNRLKRRVLKALSEAPHWHPAQKNGVAVASEGVLHIQLPKGKRMPRPVELVWR